MQHFQEGPAEESDSQEKKEKMKFGLLEKILYPLHGASSFQYIYQYNNTSRNGSPLAPGIAREKQRRNAFGPAVPYRRREERTLCFLTQYPKCPAESKAFRNCGSLEIEGRHHCGNLEEVACVLRTTVDTSISPMWKVHRKHPTRSEGCRVIA